MIMKRIIARINNIDPLGITTLKFIGERRMVKKSKEYIKGFKHGARWAIWFKKLGTNEDEFKEAIKEAVKSLKEGR